MQFLRTVFWVILAVVGVIFAYNNGQRVSVVLWGDILIDTPLWMITLLSFLTGLIPILLWHRATHWSLRRRLEAANRGLAEARALSQPVPRTEMMPPGAAPIVPPPGTA